MTTKLGLVELCIYFGVWIGTNCYLIHTLFQVQSELLEDYPQEQWSNLEPGWEFLSTYRDVSDMQWKSWKFLFRRLGYYLIFQFFISEMIRSIKKSRSYLKYWYIISSVIFVTSFMGVKQMIIITALPVLLLLIIYSGGGKRSVWVITSVLTGILNIYSSKRSVWNILKHTHDEEAFLMLWCIAWTEVRCISFCMEYIDRKDEPQPSKVAGNEITTWETVINMLSYVYYLPLLYTGSIVLYEDFEKCFQVRNDNVTTRLRSFVREMALFLLYSFFLDFSRHYIYFRGMQNEIEPLMDLPRVALCGGGLWMGYEFHIKHVVFYGIASAFARLDNMEAPPTPRCFARIYLYSEMWRYFDVGLYKFLVKYIFKPSIRALPRYVNNLPAILQKLAASLPTFAFIFIWHGSTWKTLVWTAIHFSTFTLEHLGKMASTTKAYMSFKKQVLRSDEMEVRLLALVCTPLLIVSTSTTSYLIGVANNVYAECLLQTSALNVVLVFLFMYSFCQVSIALQHVPARTEYKKPAVHRKTE